jgi:hypothetical protein
MAAGVFGPRLWPVQLLVNWQVLKPEGAIIHHRRSAAHSAWIVTTFQQQAKLSLWLVVSIMGCISSVIVFIEFHVVNPSKCLQGLFSLTIARCKRSGMD